MPLLLKRDSCVLKAENMVLSPMFLTIDGVPCSIMEALLHLVTIMFSIGSMLRALLSLVRTQELSPTLSISGLKINSVKLVSLSMQAGLVETVHGTMCFYNKEKSEKLAEDFHFLPSGFQYDNGGGQRSVLFSLEARSPTICLLIQFEKHVTKEGSHRRCTLAKSL